MTAKKKKSRSKQKARRPTATKPKQKLLFSIGDTPAATKPTKPEEQLTREQAQDARNRAILGVIAPMTIAGHARQDAQRRRDEDNDDAPMVGEAVWHVHPKQ